MAIAILLAAALAWWLHKRGELLPNLALWAGTGAAALLAFKLLTAGRILPAALVAVAGWLWWKYRQPKTPEQRALALLGLAATADADAIQAAWRSRIAQVHPDAGGSDADAQAVTAARDLLLARRKV